MASCGTEVVLHPHTRPQLLRVFCVISCGSALAHCGEEARPGAHRPERLVASCGTIHQGDTFNRG